MSEHQDRTERATPRRRQKASEKGQVSRSRELTSIAAMSGTILVFTLAGSFFMTHFSRVTGKLLALEFGRDPYSVMRHAAGEAFWIVTPFLVVSAAFAVLSGAAQGGVVLTPLRLQLDRLNPINGIKRILSLSGFVELLKSLFKLAVGCILFYCLVKKAATVLPFISLLELKELQAVSQRFIAMAVLYSFFTFLVLAVIDYLIERWRFERSIRMTKQEVREEYKETEGDPMVKSRIKSLQREMARRRMMQDVPKATVVITNPTHIAVALRYSADEMSAPAVIAKGKGFVAERIKEIAEKHAVPIVEDKPVARALYKLRLNSSIPGDLYRAVAKIIAHIYQLRRAG